MQFATVESAIEAIRNGEMLIVADDEDRENEGDLICAAELVTPEIINFMAKRASGLICLALTPERIDRLGLGLIGENNVDALRTAYTQSIDAAPKYGITTGISAQDRATTIRVAADPAERSERHSLRRPRAAAARAPGRRAAARRAHGGVGRSRAPRRARPRGRRLRDPCATTMAHPRAARSSRSSRPSTTSSSSPSRSSSPIGCRPSGSCIAWPKARLPTEFGVWRIIGYRNDVDDREHVALVHGDVDQGESILVRMHSKCLTGDVFGSMRCDCGWQLHAAMAQIEKAGKGVVVYLDQEGRGIGLLNKIKAYALQDGGADTVEANARLGLRARSPQLRHRRADPARPRAAIDSADDEQSAQDRRASRATGCTCEDRVPIHAPETAENRDYLIAKHAKLGHLLAH